jgi:hypothetical protein
MWMTMLLAAAADGPPRAIYPDDPPWGERAAAAPSYAALHSWLHARRATGELAIGLVAVGPTACRTAEQLALTANAGGRGFPNFAAARAAGFAEPGIHWLLWDGAVLRHRRPEALRPVPAETCPGGRCPAPN